MHGGPARRGTAHGRVGACRVDRRFSLGFRRSSTYGKARWRAPMCTAPPCAHMGARHQSGRFMRNRGIPAKIGTFPVGLPVSHVRISKPGTGIPAPSTPGHGPTRRSQPRKSIGMRRRAPRPPPVLSKRLTAAPTPQPRSPRPFAFGINQRLRPYAPAVTARTRSVINEHVLPHRRGGSHHGYRPEGPATAPAGPARRRQAGGQQTGPQTGRRHPTDKRNTDEAQIGRAHV